jgi:hypothetical protein
MDGINILNGKNLAEFLGHRPNPNFEFSWGQYAFEVWKTRTCHQFPYFRWPRCTGNENSAFPKQWFFLLQCYTIHFMQQKAILIMNMKNVCGVNSCREAYTLSVSRWRVRTCNDVLIYRGNTKNVSLKISQQEEMIFHLKATLKQ